MARTGMTHRAVLATAAAGSALALTACGSDGVLTNGDTAATYGSYTVSTSEVQDAMTDINVADPQGKIFGQQAAVLLALEPEASKLAKKFGKALTPSQVENEFGQRLPKGQSLNPSAIRALQANFQLSGVSQSGKEGAAAVQKLATTADIKLNPRYGAFKKGAMTKTATTWIDPAAATPQQ